MTWTGTLRGDHRGVFTVVPPRRPGHARLIAGDLMREWPSRADFGFGVRPHIRTRATPFSEALQPETRNGEQRPGIQVRLPIRAAPVRPTVASRSTIPEYVQCPFGGINGIA